MSVELLKVTEPGCSVPDMFTVGAVPLSSKMTPSPLRNVRVLPFQSAVEFKSHWLLGPEPDHTGLTTPLTMRLIWPGTLSSMVNVPRSRGVLWQVGLKELS